MAKRGLPPEEVKRRLIRLRNLEYLHEQQRFKIWHLRDENRELKKKITRKQIVVFYEEDIPIPAKKVIRKHVVEKGYCLKCKRWLSAIPLPNHKVVLGGNVQKYICYLNAMCRLSFSQTQNALKDTYQIKVSEGEIAEVLQRESVHLRPLYEQLRVKIRGEPGARLDETGWKLLQGGDMSYAWVMRRQKP